MNNYLEQLLKAQIRVFEREDKRLLERFKKNVVPLSLGTKKHCHQGSEESHLTDDQQKALDVMMSGENIFLTGKAGTGKSFVTRHFISAIGIKKRVLVCAPTGIAALNVGGTTLHRTFGVPTELFSCYSECESPKCMKVIDQADVILIDEISMCRIDIFRFVANSIYSSEVRTDRKKQVVVVGDFFQLPPVLRSEDRKDFEKMYRAKLFAFESVSWNELNFRVMELHEVVRQKDPMFMAALNNIRTGIPDFSLFQEATTDDPNAVTICGRNDEALLINRQRLSELKGNRRQYKAISWGECDAVPVDGTIELAVGARIILVANDNKGRWANGTLATATALHDKTIMVGLDDGSEYELDYYTWETKEYHVRKRSYDGKYIVDTDVIGSFSQLPVKLAYAITIHRSQGQTYDKVNIHPEGIFAEGQLYVALSRGRSLDGIRIVGHLTEKQLKTSKKVSDFYANTFMTTSSKSGGQEKVKKNTEKEVVIKRRFSTSKGNETRQRILDLVKGDPTITSSEIASTLKMNRSAVQKHLAKLTADGWLERKGSKKSGYWRLKSYIQIT